MTDDLEHAVARFGADLAAAHGETETHERTYEERTGFYGASETHTRRWKEQRFRDNLLPDVTVTWGSGARHESDRELTVAYDDVTVRLGYEQQRGGITGVSCCGGEGDGAAREQLLDDIEPLVERAYDWGALDGVSEGAASFLNDPDDLLDAGGGREDSPWRLPERYGERIERLDTEYDELCRLRAPPMDGVPLTVSPDELEQRLERVYGDERVGSQVAGRIVSQNPALFPGSRSGE